MSHLQEKDWRKSFSLVNYRMFYGLSRKFLALAYAGGAAEWEAREAWDLWETMERRRTCYERGANNRLAASGGAPWREQLHT